MMDPNVLVVSEVSMRERFGATQLSKRSTPFWTDLGRRGTFSITANRGVCATLHYQHCQTGWPVAREEGLIMALQSDRTKDQRDVASIASQVVRGMGG